MSGDASNGDTPRRLDGAFIVQMFRSGEARMEWIENKLGRIEEKLEEFRPPCPELKKVQRAVAKIETIKAQGIAVWKLVVGMFSAAVVASGLVLGIAQLLKK